MSMDVSVTAARPLMQHHYRSVDDWIKAAPPLGRDERTLMWRIGDWWLAGAQFGHGVRKAIVTAPGWRGPSHDSCRQAARVCKRFPEMCRRLHTGFAHHQAVAPLPDEVAFALLDRAVAENRSLNTMRIAARRARWFKELTGGDVVDDLNDAIRDKRKWRGILADCPWQWDSAGGLRGATTQYYPTMPLRELCALPVGKIATDDAFLFLWVPPALLMSAGSAVLQGWGFEYKVNITWDKLENYGRGSYVRTVHEHLLIGVRPQTPTHFLDNDVISILRQRRSRRNSEKPAIAHEYVQRATPGPYIELFARKRVKGWDCYGNQLSPADHQLAAD